MAKEKEVPPLEIISVVKTVLGATNIKCPDCGKEIFATELCPCKPRSYKPFKHD